MSPSIGWRDSLADILNAGISTRTPPSFNEAKRAEVVAARVAEARTISLVPLVAVFLAVFLPHGVELALVIASFWALALVVVRGRAHTLEFELNQETERLRAEARAEADSLTVNLHQANRGDEVALKILLKRWLALRPESIRQFKVDIHASSNGSWIITGRGIARDDLQASVHRIGRGGHTFLDKRKAAEIDEDFAELNGAASLSLLTALFGGDRTQQVTLWVAVASLSGGQAIPWVTLAGALDGPSLQAVLNPISSAVTAIRNLGGDVGRCRSQRMTGARDLLVGERQTHSTSLQTAPSGWREDSRTLNRLTPNMIGVAVDFGEAVRGDNSGGSIPVPPAGVARVAQQWTTAPNQANVRGQFSSVARKFVDYAGDSSAQFVPFKAYWSTYSDMSASQLQFYFSWRSAVRNHQAPPTDLSYVFVHVYELLHLIGARDATDAAQQLERVWLGYRSKFPTLDSYCVHWITDLYASEVSIGSATEFLRRALDAGARAGPDEVLLVTDLFWSASDYDHMPSPGTRLLAADPRLGNNKFYVQHNGDGWVERAYRQAMLVSDRLFVEKNKVGPREATIASDGLRPVAREVFQGAVYDWKRKYVVLGKVPALSPTGEAVRLYRNSIRFTENLLRKERGFSGMLRGIELDPQFAAVLQKHFANYIRATRPRAKVTIDIARAEGLARESTDIRARLLDGIVDDALYLQRHTADNTERATAGEQVASHDISGPNKKAFLTDLAAIEKAVSELSSPARHVLEALMNIAWEAPSGADALRTAAGGALIGPLVDEINQRTSGTMGDALVVQEQERLIVQEDFRDEVYWVLKGTLDGFVASSFTKPEAQAPDTHEAEAVISHASGFGPIELKALNIIAAGNPSSIMELQSLAAVHATSSLILLDRVNELALESEYGDILVDVSQVPPKLLKEGTEFVQTLLGSGLEPTETAPSPTIA